MTTLVQKYIKNNTESNITVEGQLIAPGSYYLIQSMEEIKLASSSGLLSHIGAGTLLVAKSDDGTSDIADVNEAINFLKGLLPVKVESLPAPFASKVLSDGRALFARKHGVGGILTTPGTSSTVVYTVPYTSCKITGVEIIGGQEGDQVDFKILDTVTGAVTTVPNSVLNQFGFGVYITAGRYEERSNYDADLFAGLQISMTYHNNSTVNHTPNFNLVLHEVK